MYYGSNVLVAQQKSETEHDDYQLWHYDDGWLINKQTALYLEAETAKGRQRLSFYHRKSGSQAKNQRWILTKEGRIALQDQPKFVLEVEENNKHVILANGSSKSFNSAISVIRLELVEAKGLKRVVSFLDCGKYVRVFYVDNNKDIIVQTKAIGKDLDPLWNKVHYLPVKGLGEKFMLEVMDFNTFINDRPLGNCHLEVTRELVKELPEGAYEGTPNGIDVRAKLTIQGQIHYKAKFFPLEPLPKPTMDFLANFKEKPFGHATFYVLITLQTPNGGFPPSDILANLFGFESQEQLLDLSEWDSIYERAEQFISKEINDLEIKGIVVVTSRKAVRERFDINEPVQKSYGIACIEIISAKNLRQAISWLAGGASDPYVKIFNLATSWVYGDSHVIYNNCDPIWEQVFYIPVYDVHEKFNLQVFDYNAFSKHQLLGFYILDLKNIIKELPYGSYEGKKFKLDANLTYKGRNRGQLSFVADFFSLPKSEEGEILKLNNLSIQHLYLLMTYQSQYGWFELIDFLARLFNFSSKEELIKAFSDFVQKDEAIHNLNHKIWATVLVTSLLKALFWNVHREWVSINNRAESWLSENVPDVEIEERLYNYSNKFVIQHFKVTQWLDENQQRSLGLLCKNSFFCYVNRSYGIDFII
ncbi:transmembrane protein [Gigaspora margarita]|uniref:Transmembrane protein n=1 Tax=Gigaspora margarita TaxID=4874 RepID=A0A8H4A529_GIGMA|nr:transmembrane protein [Gigaspora margarita]